MNSPSTYTGGQNALVESHIHSEAMNGVKSHEPHGLRKQEEQLSKEN